MCPPLLLVHGSSTAPLHAPLPLSNGYITLMYALSSWPLLIPVMLADPFLATRTTGKMSLGLVLGQGKNLFVLLVPLRRHAVETFAEYVGTALNLVTYVPLA